jgi:hypothetical protein
MTSLVLNEICQDDQRKKNEEQSGRGKTSREMTIIVSLRFFTCHFIRTHSLLYYESFHLHFPSMYTRFFALFRGWGHGELKTKILFAHLIEH